MGRLKASFAAAEDSNHRHSRVNGFSWRRSLGKKDYLVSQSRVRSGRPNALKPARANSPILERLKKPDRTDRSF